MTRHVCALFLAASTLGSSWDVSAATATFDCSYASFSDEEGLHATKELFRLTFLLDSDTDKAYMVGNNGSAELSLIANVDGFTLIEVTSTGNVMTTTVTNTGQSVHSRNGILFGDLAPSQFYGECARK
jgi:uncharacterized protein YuzE